MAEDIEAGLDRDHHGLGTSGRFDGSEPPLGTFASFHDLKAASVFITGGGAGIGAALTEGFVQQGAKVAFVQRSDAREFVDTLEEKYGNRPLFIPTDVVDTGATRRAIEAAAKAHGDISVLVNNAADDTRHQLAQTTEADFDSRVAVNLRPHFFTAQAVAPAMRDMGGGSIINFSSISFMRGSRGLPAYAMCKAAIMGLTRSLARDLGSEGIRVNALVPGWVLTKRQLDLWATPELLAAHLKTQCLPRHLVPRDMVDGVLFLASGASQMMTGQILVIDGGVVFSG